MFSKSVLSWLLVGEAGTLRNGALLAAKVLAMGMAAPHTSLPSGSRGWLDLHRECLLRLVRDIVRSFRSEIPSLGQRPAKGESDGPARLNRQKSICPVVAPSDGLGRRSGRCTPRHALSDSKRSRLVAGQLLDRGPKARFRHV